MHDIADRALATNVSNRSSVASHVEKGKTGSRRRPGSIQNALPKVEGNGFSYDT